MKYMSSAGATPNEITSTSESSSAPNLLLVPESRAMLSRFRADPDAVARYRLDDAARSYLARNDAAHRGSLADRLRREVFAALPGRAKA